MDPLIPKATKSRRAAILRFGLAIVIVTVLLLLTNTKYRISDTAFIPVEDELVKEKPPKNILLWTPYFGSKVCQGASG